jgi:hypothetical protein
MSGAMANTLFVRGTAQFGRPDIGSIISEVGIGPPGTGDDFNGVASVLERSIEKRENGNIPRMSDTGPRR